MSDSDGSSPLVVGLVAGPNAVQAMLVERTPFGRLTFGGRRVVTDVDGPTHFIPAGFDRQLAERRGTSTPSPNEERAADAWVQSIANAVAKLTFGLRSERLRLGIAVDGHLDGRGVDVVASRGGPRVIGVPSAVETALRGRGIHLDGPIGRCLELGQAWALGESASALGLLGDLKGGERALVVHWGQEVSIVQVTPGSLPRGKIELAGTRGDVGFHGLEDRWQQLAGGRRLLSSARSDHPEALSLLRRSAVLLGSRVAARLVAEEREAELAALDSERSLGITRVVLGGTLGRALLDARMDQRIFESFQSALEAGLRRAPEIAERCGMLAAPSFGPEGEGAAEAVEVADAASQESAESAESTEGAGVPGLAEGAVQVSREANGPLIGAGALAIQVARHLDRSSGGPRS